MAAALLLAVSATPAATADISFSGRVINPDKAAFVPDRAMVRIVGNHAIFDVAVASPDGFDPAQLFTATNSNGDIHPVVVMNSRIRNGVLVARVQVGTSGNKRQQISLCLQNLAARQLCGRFTINHLY